MSAAGSLAYTYAYRSESVLAGGAGPKHLYLATSAPVPSTAYFRGRLRAPKRAADQLLALSDVIRSRFHVPSAMLGKILLLADPVITCGVERLRFEGFSSCCGVYARLDLMPAALEGDFLGSGTSNVDFNPPMRAALARIRDDDAVTLAISEEAFELRRNAVPAVERKVDLPLRWLRGFTEVQAIQAGMTPRLEIDGVALRRFLRDLPSALKGEAWVLGSSGGLRLSERSGPGAVSVGGVTRLRALRTPAQHAVVARVYAPDGGAASAWVLETPDSRFTLVLSPDVWRGFSGEGRTLDAIASGSAAAALAATRAALRWQNALDPEAIADAAGLEPRDVRAALAECAAAGLVGYDLTERAYFHRELPFDLSAGRKRQPRLRAAERLAGADLVTFDADAGSATAWVRSGGVEYRVVLDGDTARCTCPWYAKHRDERGPCKHVLAVRLKREGGDGNG